MLHLAPYELRLKAFNHLVAFVKTQWGDLGTGRFETSGTRKRWYDLSDEVSGAVEFIRHGNDRMKALSADQLLAVLEQAA